MVASLRSQLHISGMSSDAPTPFKPGQTHENDPHRTIDPQASTAVHDTSLLPTSSTSMNKKKCNHNNMDRVVQDRVAHVQTLQKQIPPRADTDRKSVV